MRYISNFCRLEKYTYASEGNGEEKSQSYLFDINWNVKRVKENNMSSKIEDLQLSINRKEEILEKGNEERGGVDGKKEEKNEGMVGEDEKG